MNIDNLNKAIKQQRGLSYVEVLIAIVIMAVALVPTIEALFPAIKGVEIHQSETNLQYQLRARLESLLAESFDDLDNEAQTLADPTAISATYSDTAGSTNRRLVFLSRYDSDNADANNNPFNGMDEGLIWIRVEIENTRHAIETLKSVYD